MKQPTVGVTMTEHPVSSKPMLGFWLYLMTDCILFASLFATYAVLQDSTFGGPGAKELFDLPFVLAETVLLLVSSFLCGLALLAGKTGKTRQLVSLLVLTGLLGIIFLGMELYEFRHLIDEGNSWTRSGFLSAFFTLVATHGLHIASGLLWLLVLIVQIAKRGITENIVKRLTLFSMFWHFLDVIWILIFTVVYLLGVTP